MKRRIFIENSGKAALLASLGVLAACGGDSDPGPSQSGSVMIDLSVSPFDQLQTEGNWVLHPDENIILVNDFGTLRALSSVCTHSGCSRNWSFSAEARCTCHGSKFNKMGEVTNGPAIGNLKKFDIEVSGDNAVVTK